MIPQRVPALRHSVSRGAPNVRPAQRRWAEVHDVRFLATHRQPDRVAEKYRDKLQEKARAYARLIRDDMSTANVGKGYGYEM